MQQPNWPKIIDDLYSGLPNPIYLDFVADTLLGANPKSPGIDPFGIQMPIPLADYYVDRDEIEKAILSPGNRVLLGKYGTGKTTLFNKLSDDLKRGKETLVVKMALMDSGGQKQDQKESSQEKSPLCLEKLVYAIFNAYWEDFILPSSPIQAKSDDARQKYLPRFRREQRWMRLLGWFYHHFPPVQQNISDDFELMAWLKFTKDDVLFGCQISPETILQELVYLIFYTTEIRDLSGRPFGPRYQQIIIFMDGVESLSPSTIKSLLSDFQYFCDLQIPNLEIKFFAEQSKKDSFLELECVQDGRVILSNLLPWSDSQLRELLNLRRKACLRGAYGKNDPWIMTLPLQRMEYSTRYSLVQSLIKGVHSTTDNQHRFDIPIHLLKLTRGAVAACAGAWLSDGLTWPIRQEDIDALIKAYWRHTQ